jgi:hypothetical protein
LEEISMVSGKAIQSSNGPIRYGMVGGGQGAFIGGVHRIAARLDGEFDLSLEPSPPIPKRQRLRAGNSA